MPRIMNMSGFRIMNMSGLSFNTKYLLVVQAIFGINYPLDF